MRDEDMEASPTSDNYLDLEHVGNTEITDEYAKRYLESLEGFGR